MSVILISDKNQTHSSLEKFIDYLKGLLVAPPVAKQEDGSAQTEIASQTEEKAKSAEFMTKGKQLLKNNEYKALISHILTLDELLFRESKQSVSIFYIIGMICTKISEEKEQHSAAQTIVNHIINSQTIHVSLKFKILATLFNTFPEESKLRVLIWKSLTKLAEDTNRPTVLLVHIINLHQYLAQWKLSLQEEVEVYRGALNLLDKTQEKLISERLDIYTRFLNIFERQFDAKLYADSAKEIKNILIFILQNLPQSVNYGKFLEYKAIKEISKSDAKLYELLEMIVQGNVSDYQKQNFTSTISAHGLDAELILERIRVNSIFQLARTSRNLTLKAIASKLSLSEDDVEVCVVRAIQKGDLEGKIDQIEGVVYITSLNETSCRSNEWKSIGESLGKFKNVYTQFLETLKSSRR
jgi:hypothetical protein